MAFGFVRRWVPRMRHFDRSRHALGGLCAVVLLAALSACASAPPATFDLTAPNDSPSRTPGRGQLVVYEPAANLPIDSNRIVIRTGPDAVAYLKGAQWADKLTRLVQARLIESFENAHSLRAVGRPGMVADYSLHAEIRRFEADVTRNEAAVEIAARIVGANGHTVAMQSFSATSPLANDDGRTVTASLDDALGKVMRQIVVWATPKV